MTMHVHQRQAPPIAPCLGMLVQLVERDPVQLQLHRIALERAGAVVHATASPDDVLAIASEIDVDVLVCDVELEELDGLTLLRVLRRLRPELVRLPAIAMSSNQDEDEIADALKAGFHIHAIKPIAPYDLVEMVTGVTRRSNQAVGSGRA